MPGHPCFASLARLPDQVIATEPEQAGSRQSHERPSGVTPGRPFPFSRAYAETQRSEPAPPLRRLRAFVSRLTSVGANHLEAIVQGPWTSWGLHTRQGSYVLDSRQHIQTYAIRRRRLRAR